MKFDELENHLVARKYKPCYLAFGDDRYLVRLAVEMFSALVKEFPEFNVSILQDDATVQDIEAAASALPLMAPHRLVIAPAKFAPSLKDYLKNPAPQTIILLTEHKDTAKAQAGIESIECSRLSEASLVSRLNKECALNGVEIRSDAARLLCAYSGGYAGRAVLEIEKLISFKGGRGAITRDDVEQMVAPDLEYRAFELTDAIAIKQTEKALLVLADMLKGSGQWVMAFGFIYGHFRRLLYVSLAGESDISAELGAKEYTIKIARRQAKAFSKLKLKEILERLHYIDSGIKSGIIPERGAFESFVIDACDAAVPFENHYE